MRLLIADDEKGLVELMGEALTRRGHAVDTALDGKKALALIETGAYDVAFIDVSMPEVTGIEIVERARKLGLKTKLVMITGYQEVEDFFIKAAGADEYLTKPLKFEDIQKLLLKYST